MSKTSDYVMNWRNRVKLKLIEYKGGSCCKCGYNKLIPSVYDFHHLNPEEKDFSISGKSYSFEKLKSEVDKCILVCRNCHAEIHFEIERIKREERLKIKQVFLENKNCDLCLNSFKPINFPQKFCSNKCKRLASRKVERPSKEELEKLLWKIPTKYISKKLGVSDKAVQKWCKDYNLQKPPRGYWQKNQFIPM